MRKIRGVTTFAKIRLFLALNLAAGCFTVQLQRSFLQKLLLRSSENQISTEIAVAPEAETAQVPLGDGCARHKRLPQKPLLADKLQGPKRLAAKCQSCPREVAEPSCCRLQAETEATSLL